MNITLNKTDSVNATLTVDVAKVDYENEVEKSLKNIQKTAVVAGFRKGMVPAGLLRQKYGKSILIEEINKTVSKSLSDYIKENSLNFLGEPLPSEQQTPIDFDNPQEDFTFVFDIGIAPEINVKLTTDDKIPYYLMQVTDELLDKQIKNLQAQNGKHESVEDVEDTDMIKGRLVELNDAGEPESGGIDQNDAVLMPAYMKNEEEKAKFMNAKLHSTVIFNPYKAYNGNEVELASFLKIKKDEVKYYTGNFSIEIEDIKRYKEAEIGQELFDKLFGEGTVDSEATFREKIKGIMEQQLTPESDRKFLLDTMKLLAEKAVDASFPDAFLKRWLLTSNSKYTPENVDEEYQKLRKDLTLYLIKEHLIEENNITIEEGELEEYTMRTAQAQLAQYGMNNLSDQALKDYVQDMLKKPETYRLTGDKIFENKLIEILKEQVTLEPQKITIEEFQKLI